MQLQKNIVESSGELLESKGISEVERDTGITRENLRTWERRYGFPMPLRDAHGERLYPRDQVEKIFQIRRLMDAGHRPRALVQLPVQELRSMGVKRKLSSEPQQEAAGEIAVILQAVKRGDARTLRKHLRWQLSALGAHRFVAEIVAPLSRLVGEQWSRGELPVHMEHLFAEQIEAILRTAIAQHAVDPFGPRILLATVAGERHRLGLLMLETVLSVELAECISLGTCLPAAEIAEAAKATGADIVALSFSRSFSAKAAVQSLVSLRALLPSETMIWAGGGCLERLRKRPAGVLVPMSLEAAVTELRKLRH